MSAPHIISIANQKGGVGKTTTALNLSAGLARLGQRCLLVDLDPQANATLASLGKPVNSPTVYEMMTSDAEASDVIRQGWPGVDVLPSSIDLAAAEVELLSAVGGQLRLRNRLAALNSYDFVIIDAPPSLGLLTVNALAAARFVIVPVDAGLFALAGLSALIRTVTQVRDNLAGNLQILGVLATMAEHTNVAKDVESTLRKQFGDVVFNVMIPKNVKLVEAAARAQSVFDYDPAASGALAYGKLAEEVSSRVG